MALNKFVDANKLADEKLALHEALKKTGKVRRKALKRQIEASRVLPAIRDPETRKITRGLPGESHFEVMDRESKLRGFNPEKNFKKYDDLVDKYTGKVADEGTGFADPRTGKYLTREEAFMKVGRVPETQALASGVAQEPMRLRLAETRRGLGKEETKLFRGRKAAQTATRFLSNAIRTATNQGNQDRVKRLLQKRKHVISFAKRNKYLGMAIAAGELASRLGEHNENAN